MRRHLVEQLRAKGITDENVLSAIGSVPRHLFMDSGFESHAYQDKAFPIAARHLSILWKETSNVLIRKKRALNQKFFSKAFSSIYVFIETTCLSLNTLVRDSW